MIASDVRLAAIYLPLADCSAARAELHGMSLNLESMYQGRPLASFNTAVFEQWSGLLGQQVQAAHEGDGSR